MFDNIINFFKRFGKNEKENSKNTAKERLHLVLAQDRANISADFLEMMKQEIIDVIKKYIDIDEEAIDVRMTNKPGEDGIVGAPALYANIPIVTIKNEARKLEGAVNKEEVSNKKEKQQEEVVEEIKENNDKQNELEVVDNEEQLEEKQKQDVTQEVEIEEISEKENKKDKLIKGQKKREEKYL